MRSNWIRRDKRLAIYLRDGLRCAYCLSPDNLTVDHVIPRHAGGTNHESNLVTACVSCNSAKAGRSVRAYFALLRKQGVSTDIIGLRVRHRKRRDLAPHRKQAKAILRKMSILEFLS